MFLIFIKGFMRFALLYVLCFVIHGCVSHSTNYERLEVSLREWKKMNKKYGGDYTYEMIEAGPLNRTLIKKVVQIRNNRVIRIEEYDRPTRTYRTKKDSSPQTFVNDFKLRFVAEGDRLAFVSIPLTIDEMYDYCKKRVLTKDTSKYDVKLLFFPVNNILKYCDSQPRKRCYGCTPMLEGITKINFAEGIQIE